MSLAASVYRRSGRSTARTPSPHASGDDVADGGIRVGSEPDAPVEAADEADAVYVRDPFGYRVKARDRTG